MNLPDRRIIRRRSEDTDPLIELDEHIADAKAVFGQLEQRAEEIAAMLKAHIADEDVWKTTVFAAFPDGPQAHRAAHEAMIEQAKAETDFYRKLKLSLAEKGFWALLKFIGLLLVAGAALKLGVHIDAPK